MGLTAGKGRGALIVVLATMVTSLGCYSSTIYDRIEEPKAEQPVQKGRLVLGDLKRDPDIITEEFAPFFAAIRRGMEDQMPETGIGRVIEERDAGALREGRTFLVRYRARDFRDALEPNGGRLAAVMFCPLTLVVCPFIGLPPVAYETVGMTWEMRVYDVSELEPTRARDPEADEMVVAYDTSELMPLTSQDYEVRVEAAQGELDAEEQLDFSREVAAEVSRRLIAKSIDDVGRAIANAPAPRQTGARAVETEPAPATSGGELTDTTSP